MKRRLKKMSSDGSRDSNILLIDCSTLIYAAFYAMGSLSYNGQQTGIIYGFLRKILMLARKFDTNRFVTCWDAGLSHRHYDYGPYKQKRLEKKKSFTEQEQEDANSRMLQSVQLNHEILPNLGFNNNYIQLYYEADDLLAHWCNRLMGAGRLVVVTTDTDMYQLLDRCDIFNPSTKKMFTEKHLMEKHGVTPRQWVQAKAIGGCSGDGVIGIEGVADPKKVSSKALTYLRGELGPGKVLDRIESTEGQKIIERNKKLVFIPYKEDMMKKMIPRRDIFTSRRFIRVFDKYHFKSFLADETFQQWQEAFLRR